MEDEGKQKELWILKGKHAYQALTQQLQTQSLVALLHQSAARIGRSYHPLTSTAPRIPSAQMPRHPSLCILHPLSHSFSPTLLAHYSSPYFKIITQNYINPRNFIEERVIRERKREYLELGFDHGGDAGEEIVE